MQDDKLRHDLSNLLGVALANVEGMADGIVPVTPERLEAVAESLRKACDAVETLRGRKRG
ncbi:MAG TPA: hypothetical protein VMD47_01290 [Candidatus Acidoferrales bacterium]|nr:hypothetical protein [Candidatus Acidoferrales bacterium]